jgi:hypothetical protein
MNNEGSEDHFADVSNMVGIGSEHDLMDFGDVQDWGTFPSLIVHCPLSIVHSQNDDPIRIRAFGVV